ncbi:MAG: hypothetical protein N3E40_04235, partial [Dehalococcoidia bacterium]|nr:hypothetical protein [Dehalococcoidia bacterium]
MKRSAGTHSITGIRIRVHYTCAVAFVLMAAVVATQLPEGYSFWQKAVIGILTALVFFVLLLVRELVINLASGRGRGPVKEVMLFPFGGVCLTTEELPLPGHELLMAAARLLSSLAIAVMMYGVYALSISYDNLTVAGIAEWLAFTWASIFLLNFFPALPLDGGMVLRALLLKRSGNYYQATCTSSTVGRVAGLILIFGGVTLFITAGQWLTALVITVAGWCLQSASASVRRWATLFLSLEPTVVRDVMTGDYVTVDRDLTIGRLYREHILVSGWDYYVVTDGTSVTGIVSEREVKSVSWKRWESTRVGDVMVPLDDSGAVNYRQSGATALRVMD